MENNIIKEIKNEIVNLINSEQICQKKFGSNLTFKRIIAEEIEGIFELKLDKESRKNKEIYFSIKRFLSGNLISIRKISNKLHTDSFFKEFDNNILDYKTSNNFTEVISENYVDIYIDRGFGKFSFKNLQSKNKQSWLLVIRELDSVIRDGRRLSYDDVEFIDLKKLWNSNDISKIDKEIIDFNDSIDTMLEKLIHSSEYLVKDYRPSINILKSRIAIDVEKVLKTNEYKADENFLNELLKR